MPYLWDSKIQDYHADNIQDYPEIIEVSKLNFFIGRNNSGKSRFLRFLFSGTTTLLSHQPYSINSEAMKVKVASNIRLQANNLRGIYGIDNFRIPSINKLHTTESINQFFDTYIDLHSVNLQFKNSPQSTKLIHFLSKLSVSIKNGHSSYTPLAVIDPYEQILQTDLKFDFQNRYYIPVLRGMRPLNSDINTHVYSHRSKNDYAFENSDSIITGENLYSELQNRLLGEPEDREIIQHYQSVLSQYFFDNETITLIPKIGTDVVHIKIGDAKQFPIYQLGDGLQQAIILTYDAFLRKDEIHAYFIEEPELHMHAGMVRQMMNFYLNETQHYYFFTTHSNHLLDMADESDEVMIQKFSKHTDETGQTTFQINRCDRDRDLLQSLGVKPSSVYLANCTIWVEGITDRLYLLKYMERYLEDLKSKNQEKYARYRRFMLHYHFAFVEYAGANMVHWSFENAVKLIDGAKNKGLSARAIASEMLLIADADTDKGQRIPVLRKELGADKFQLLEVKEIENTLPKTLLLTATRNRFASMKANTKKGFDIELLNEDTIDFNNSTNGIGRILDNAIRVDKTKADKKCFSEDSGTIKRKLEFCHEIIKLMDEQQWELTDEARELVATIFRHIEKNNA